MLGIRTLRSSTSTASRSLKALSPSSTSPNSRRHFSISSVQLEEKVKVPVTLIASLRKLHPVPIASAREALSRSNLDLAKAIDYLQSSTSSNASAEKKAAKVSGRSTNEGVISLSLLGNKRVGMIHLACETDFVARNDVFLNTAKGVAETTAFLDVPGENDTPTITSSDSSTDPILSFPTESLLSAPLISISNSTSDPSTPLPTHTHDPLTIRQTLLSSLSQTGENLQLLRAVSFAAPFPSSPNVRFVPGAYAHGGPSDKQGKVGGIVILSITSRDTEKPIATMIHSVGGDSLEEDLNSLARTVARQVVGFPTKVIEKSDVAIQDEEVLLEQPFMMFQGDSRKVKDVLEEWGKERGVNVKVVGLRRWAVGDEL